MTAGRTGSLWQPPAGAATPGRPGGNLRCGLRWGKRRAATARITPRHRCHTHLPPAPCAWPACCHPCALDLTQPCIVGRAYELGARRFECRSRPAQPQARARSPCVCLTRLVGLSRASAVFNFVIWSGNLPRQLPAAGCLSCLNTRGLQLSCQGFASQPAACPPQSFAG